MNRMKSISYSFLLLLLVQLSVFGQSNRDSLRSIAANTSLSDSTRFYAYNEIASSFIRINNDSAAYYNQLTQKLVNNNESKDYEVEILFVNAGININKWSLDSLKTAYEYVLEHQIKKDNKKKIINTLINLGGCHASRGFFKKGISYYLQASDYAKEENDIVRLGKINFNIGAAYYNATLFNESRRKFKEAAEYFKLVKNDARRAICLNSISNAYNNEGIIDSAFFFAKQTLLISDSIDYTKLQSSVRSTIGAIHINKKEYTQASKAFSEALSYAEILNDEFTIANCHCNIGRAKNHLKQHDVALYHLTKAYSFPIFKDNDLFKQFCLKEYAQALQENGRQKEAFDMLNTYLTFQDSVKLKENKQVIAELESKYNSLQKDTEIQQQQQKLMQQTTQRNFLFGGLGSLALISLLIINRLFLKQRLTKNKLDIKEEKIQNLEHKQKLLALDYMVQGQEEERRRIATDLHDGLGGILSTARLQLSNIVTEIHKLEDLKLLQNAELLLENASEEVRRIAHDMMPDALMNLGLQAAIEDLANHVNQSNQIHVKTQFYMADTILDEKIEVMLFRIIQEILNNTIKHAQASEVLIQMSVNNTQQLHLTMEDNGVGFDQAIQSSSEGVGIKNINSRVKYLNGELHLESGPGKGTAYDVLIPI